MLRNALMAVPIVGTGDVAAQWLENHRRGRAQRLDGVRVAAIGAFGLTVFGPVMHTWFRVLARFFPNATSLRASVLKACATSVCVAPLLNSSYFYFTSVAERALQKYRSALTLTMPSAGVAGVAAADDSASSTELRGDGDSASSPPPPGYDLRSRRKRIREDLPIVLVHNFYFWIPTNTINFWLVPLRHRVVFGATASMFWNFYLSMVGHRFQDVPPPPAELGATRFPPSP